MTQSLRDTSQFSKSSKIGSVLTLLRMSHLVVIKRSLLKTQMTTMYVLEPVVGWTSQSSTDTTCWYNHLNGHKISSRKDSFHSEDIGKETKSLFQFIFDLRSSKISLDSRYLESITAKSEGVEEMFLNYST